MYLLAEHAAWVILRDRKPFCRAYRCCRDLDKQTPILVPFRRGFFEPVVRLRSGAPCPRRCFRTKIPQFARFSFSGRRLQRGSFAGYGAAPTLVSPRGHKPACSRNTGSYVPERILFMPFRFHGRLFHRSMDFQSDGHLFHSIKF